LLLLYPAEHTDFVDENRGHAYMAPKNKNVFDEKKFVAKVERGPFTGVRATAAF
jgi:hypothetical protein